MPPISAYVISGLLLGCFWAVLCRLAALRPSWRTLPVAIQHMALGIGIFGGMWLPGEQARDALAIGLAAFMFIGAFRWVRGAPEGINGPDSLMSK